jgi:Flp pilus assembly protein TadG
MTLKTHRGQRGVALVEFALVLPLVLVMTCVTTELGRAYYQYNTITKSVREAARYLSVRTAGVDEINAKNIVVYGNPDAVGSPIVAGLTLANVSIPPRGTVGSYPILNTVTVTVSGYTFIPMVSSVFGFNLNNIAFGAIQATMRSPS